MSEARCETCRWWDSDTYSVKGRCHRYPPTPESHMVGQRRPSTVPHDWCGEHQPKEQQP